VAAGFADQDMRRPDRPGWRDCFPCRRPYLFGRIVSTERRGPVIESPCNRVCTLDPVSGLCRGCGRSLDEIARWTQMTDAERARVVAELGRRSAIRPRPPMTSEQVP
jgi:predicted Fe-S protein YdhL (DUF1289 family)